MILRRITEHVKAQNWTAVALDFVIVVVGVFIGIQVANWNDGRVSEATAAAYLSQLKDEIEFNDESVNYQARYVDRVVEGGRRGLAFIDNGEACIADCERLLIDFFHASQVWGTSYTDTTYQEMLRLGLPKDREVRLAVQEFYNFLDGWDVVNASPPVYRERIRGLISEDAAPLLWRECYRITGGTIEELLFDCEEALKAIDLAPTLDRIRKDPEIATMLRYWVGQNEYARQFYPQMNSQARTAIQVIEAALEDR